MQTTTAAASKKTAAPAIVKKTASKKPAAKVVEQKTIAEVKLIPLDLIDTQEQIRTEFEPESIRDLAEDIKERGLLQPILLNPINDRYCVIAGERRLRAVKLNGATGIPALLVKASTDEAMLMQLAENVQREELTLDEECKAIVKLYELLGSLEKVAAAVKKSKPWCSKRYASIHGEMHYVAKRMLEDGDTEDLELLNALSSLAKLVGWDKANHWANQIREGKAGRNEIREALKKAKEAVKEEKKANTPAKVSHAKPKEPPPPPEWTMEDAWDDLCQAATWKYSEMTAVELVMSWTPEQRSQIEARLNNAAEQGQQADGFKKIADLVVHGMYDTEYTDLDLLAMIAGNKGIKFDWLGMLTVIQVPIEGK